MMAKKDRKAKPYNGVSFNRDAFKEDITKDEFVERGITTGKYAKQFPDNEAKQRELLAGAYDHLFPAKKESHQDSLSADLVKKNTSESQQEAENSQGQG